MIISVSSSWVCWDVSSSPDLTCPSANILFFTRHDLAMLFLLWNILTIRRKHVIVAVSNGSLPKYTDYAEVENIERYFNELQKKEFLINVI